MSALLFLSYRRLKNGLFQLLKPKFIVTICIYIAIITIPFLFYPLEDIRFDVSNEFYLMGCWLLYGLISSALIVNIILAGVIKFERSDADYLISSPIKPKYIFLYGFFQKYKKNISILILIFICLGVFLKYVTTIATSTYLKTILVLLWLLFIIFVSALHILKHITKRNKSKTVLWIFAIIYSAVTIVTPLVDLFYPIDFGKWGEYIPLCGWSIKILSSWLSFAATGRIVSCVIIAISCLACAFILMKQDFSCYYNCFLESSKYTKKTHQNRKESKNVYGSGVTALIGKDCIEVLRKDKIPFVDIGTFFISIFVLVLGIGLSQSYTEQGEPLSPILILLVPLLILALSSVLCFNVNSIKNELGNIYIHLFPASAYIKIVALTVIPCMRNFSVALVLILVLSIISNATILLLTYIIVLYLSIALLLMATNVLFIRFFGSEIDESFGLWVYLKLILGFIIMLPAGIIFIAILVLFDSIIFHLLLQRWLILCYI